MMNILKGNIFKASGTFKSQCTIICAFIILFGIRVSAQSFGNKDSYLTLTGKVIDAQTKKPINTAQVTLLNFPMASNVNDEGVFKLSLPTLTGTISVSAIDYGTREIVIKGADTITVELYSVFFKNKYKKTETLTGLTNNTLLTQSINSIDNISTSPYASIDNEIQSQLGGSVRSIARSGVAGIGSSLFMQGYNSLYANSQPLFVVDGIIWDNTFEMESLHSGYYINPLLNIDVADIESVTVIKDGTSVYGSKGANGVILIKTKRGRDMVTKINVSSIWGISSTPKLVPVLNASQSKIYASEVRSSAIKQYINTINTTFLQEDPSVPSYPVYHNNTNWADEVYRNGITQSYAVNVTGGDERALYMFSIGYTGNTGIVKNTDLQRFNARFNADINFTNKLSVSWNIGYTDINRSMLNDGVDSVSPTYLAYVKPSFLSPHKYTSAGESDSKLEDADVFDIGNPTAIIQNSENASKQNRFDIGILPTLKLTPNISIQNQFGYTLYNVRENFFRHDLGSVAVPMPELDLIAINETKKQHIKNISLFNDAHLIFNFYPGMYNHLKGVVGWRYYNYYNKLNGGLGYNTTNNNTGLDYAYYKEAYGAIDKNISVSNYLNIDYDYKLKYLLSVAFDMDASSRFGSETKGGVDFLGKKWGMFPSVNGAWIASSERFMKSCDFINFLKFRAGYGITGNDDITSFTNKPSLISKNYIGYYYGLVIGNIANNQIQWETTYRTNIGFDLGLFNERVSISGSYYQSKTKDLLTLAKYPEISGLNSYYFRNSGELENKGFDLETNVKVLNLSSVKWEAGFSVGHYKNKIVSLPEGKIITQVYGGEVITEVGKSAALFYGYKTSGVYATQSEAVADHLSIIDELGNRQFFGAGDMHFVDVDSNDTLNKLDKQVIGDPNPDFYGSFNTRVFIKNFTIEALFTFSYGNDVYNYLRSQLEAGSSMYNQSISMINRWRADGQQTSIPKITYGDPMHNAAFSDRWIEDGSFLKFKTLTVSYKIPVKSKFIQGVSAWMSVNNLFTLTKYLGSDPESSVNNSVFCQGIDIGLISGTRSYFMGVKISL